MHRGRYAEAETLGLEALELLRRVLGPGHPKTLASILNLAAAAALRGARLDAPRFATPSSTDSSTCH